MYLGPRCGVTGREAPGVPGLLTLAPHDVVPVGRVERRARELVIEGELTRCIPLGRCHARVPSVLTAAPCLPTPPPGPRPRTQR